MKKKQLLVSFAALAAGLIGLYSCAVKEEAPAKGISEDVQVIVNLDQIETKTLNNGNATVWADDDKISIIGTEYGEEVYIANYLTYRGDNTFGGHITYPADDNNWYFVYPYREDNVTPREIHITVNKEQEQVGNDSMAQIAGDGFPLIGKVIELPRSKQIEVNMRNVLARLDFEITNVLDGQGNMIVKQVVFTTPHKISGNFVGDMTNDNVTWNPQSGASQSVTLNVTDGTAIAADGTAKFYVGILPTTIAAGESMKIKVVAYNTEDPDTEIVYYRAVTVDSNTHLVSGKTYSFDMSKEKISMTDPLPNMENQDEPDEPEDPTPGGDDNPTTETAYVKVTSEPTSWDGTYLFVDESNGKAFAAFSANSSSYAVNVTISNGKIAATSDIAKYALTVSDAGEEHANVSGQEAYNVKNSDGKYIFFSSGTIQILDTNRKASGGSSSSSSQYTYYHAFKYNNNGVQVLSSGHSSGFNKYYLGYNSNSFGYFTESSSSSSESYYLSNASNLRVQLYKLTESSTPSDPTKLNQNLSFAQSSVTLTMATAGGTQAVQTVSGAQTSPVTYASSNSSVATVSGTTININGFGSTTITATAPASDTYNSGSASYTLTIQQSGASTTTTYTKATSLTVGGTYVITDVSDTRLFKGATDGSYVSVSPSSGVISDPANSLAAYEFTVTQSGSKYCLIFNDGKYLLCDYSNNGNSTTGLVYESSKPSDTYLYSVSVNNNGAFEFMTGQRNSSSTSEVLYYKTSSDLFKIGGSGVNVGVHLYLKTSSGSGAGKQNQTLSFAQSTVTLSMATASGTQAVQTVSGAQTDVTYSSTNTSVATVSGTTITIKGFGTTTITATAAENSSYNSASASYTLVINQTGGGSSTGERTYTYQSSVSAGTYLIGGYESSGSQYSIALFPTVLTGNWESSQGTVSNGEYIGQRDIDSSNTLTFNNDSDIFNAEVDLIASGNNWKIRINSTGKYLAVPSQDNRIVYVDSESSATAFSISGGSSYSSSGSNMGISSGNYYFYHSGSAHGFSMRAYQVTNIRLYKKTSEGGSSSGKQYQNLSFASSSVSLTLESASGSYQVQTVSGNQTSPITYTSSNSSVATVSGTTITITGFGSTEITASVPADDSYYAASKSYTLYVNRAQQEGVFNLENDLVYNYLNEATSTYTAANHSSTTLIKSGYGNNGVYSYNGVNYTPSSNSRWDFPKPVTVTWSSVLSGNKQVYVYTDAAHTQQVDYIENPISVTSSTNTAEIYNLIPGITYYYVVTSSGSNVASGDFTTEGRRRMMKISTTYNQNNANNCRDLGGQITTSGKRIKYGKIYRGSNMDGTSSDEKKILKQYMKIELDVDLRGSDRNDALSLGDITNKDAATYRGHTNESYNSSSDLRNSDQRMGATLTRIMNAVHNNVNVYVHCMVGADRTGFTCMMIEAILGIPLERCDMDYEMTSFSVVGTRPRNSSSISHYNDGVNAVNGRLSGQSNATYQDKAIDYAVNYFGVSRDLITQFQNDMLE